MDTSQLNKREYSSFGRKIKKQLIDKNMTAKQLADALGTTPQYLNKIIHGERSGEKYIEAIKSILDIAA
ncbi:MAG: helix-turn-helix transcriptional regulator [Lachnospiraceae bacterium]|nr:helix-turn-helix transcriptional regulator [Lachnospiraceae bacterium]